MIRRLATLATLAAGLTLVAPAAHADRGNHGDARISVSQACVANPAGPGRRVLMVWDVYSSSATLTGVVTRANHTPGVVNGTLAPYGMSGVGIVYVRPGRTAHFHARITMEDGTTYRPHVRVPAWTCSGRIPR